MNKSKCPHCNKKTMVKTIVTNSNYSKPIKDEVYKCTNCKAESKKRV